MKLTINVQKPRESNLTLREETSYRWDRIAATGLGAFTLLAVIVWVFWPTSERQNTEQLALQESTDLPLFSSEAVEPPSPPLQGNTGDSPTRLGSPSAAATSASESLVDSSDDGTTPESNAPGNLDALGMGPLEAKTPASSRTPTSSSPNPSNALAVAAESGLFSQPSTTIHSDKIKRFTLARSVRDKEPVGALEDVTLSDDKVATVFAYSEAMDLKDDTLRYIWKLNGSELAQVKVPVWSARWRSHSSKYVTPRMRGDWQVELRTSSGELLAMSEFQY